MPPSDTPSTTCTPENESTPVDLELKAYLECLSRIESVITAKKKESSFNPLLFLVKVEKVLARIQQRCKTREKKQKRKKNSKKKQH